MSIFCLSVGRRIELHILDGVWPDFYSDNMISVFLNEKFLFMNPTIELALDAPRS